MKTWPSDLHCLIDGGVKCQKSYPGDNWLVAGKSSYRPCLVGTSLSALPIPDVQQRPRVGLYAH